MVQISIMSVSFEEAKLPIYIVHVRAAWNETGGRAHRNRFRWLFICQVYKTVLMFFQKLICAKQKLLHVIIQSEYKYSKDLIHQYLPISCINKLSVGLEGVLKTNIEQAKNAVGWYVCISHFTAGPLCHKINKKLTKKKNRKSMWLL